MNITVLKENAYFYKVIDRRTIWNICHFSIVVFDFNYIYVIERVFGWISKGIAFI